MIGTTEFTKNEILSGLIKQSIRFIVSLYLLISDGGIVKLEVFRVDVLIDMLVPRRTTYLSNLMCRLHKRKVNHDFRDKLDKL